MPTAGLGLVEAEAGTELCAVVAAVLDEEADARVGAVDDEPFFSPSPPFSFRDGVGRLPPVDVCCCCPPLAGWLPVCFDPDAVLDAVPLGAVGVGAGAERAEWDSTVPAVVDADGCFFSLGGGSAGACSSPLPIFSTWISGASSELSLPGEVGMTQSDCPDWQKFSSGHSLFFPRLGPFRSGPV